MVRGHEIMRSHDAADEVVIADGAVGGNVDLTDSLVKLVWLELLPDGGEDVAEVGDESQRAP
jgi:hypothetical protein